MTATPGVFLPVPVVSIDGVDVAQGATVDGHLPGLVVVDGLEFDWGRDEVLEQAVPPTGTLQLFDPSGRWATSADLRGKAVTIGWTGNPGTGVIRRTIFRGRVGSPVQLARKVVTLPDGSKVAGALVTLPLVSILLDLANMRPTVAWPEETVEARRARIAAAVVDVVADVQVRDYWKTPNVQPVAAKDQVTYLQHLEELYDSTGADRMIYLPDTNVLTYLERRDFYTSRGLGRLWWETTTGPRAGNGVFVRATDSAGTALVGLDAAALEYDPSDGITQPERITRVELVHTSSPSMTSRTVTRLVTGQDEKRSGVRTLRFESQVTWDAYADTAASDLEDLVQKEAAVWRLEPLTYRTKPLGGFETAEHAELLLKGAEVSTLLFLQRSWLPAFGLRPLFGVMGGTIAYRSGGWQVTWTPAPITTTLPQHAISWSEIDDGSAGYEVQWWDDDHPHGMDASLTLDDLGYVARGLGASPAIGLDTGWDTLQ